MVCQGGVETRRSWDANVVTTYDCFYAWNWRHHAGLDYFERLRLFVRVEAAGTNRVRLASTERSPLSRTMVTWHHQFWRHRHHENWDRPPQPRHSLSTFSLNKKYKKFNRHREERDYDWLEEVDFVDIMERHVVSPCGKSATNSSGLLQQSFSTRMTYLVHWSCSSYST